MRRLKLQVLFTFACLLEVVLLIYGLIKSITIYLESRKLGGSIIIISPVWHWMNVALLSCKALASFLFLTATWSKHVVFCKVCAALCITSMLCGFGYMFACTARYGNVASLMTTYDYVLLITELLIVSCNVMQLYEKHNKQNQSMVLPENCSMPPRLTVRPQITPFPSGPQEMPFAISCYVTLPSYDNSLLQPSQLPNSAFHGGQWRGSTNSSGHALPSVEAPPTYEESRRIANCNETTATRIGIV